MQGYSALQACPAIVRRSALCALKLQHQKHGAPQPICDKLFPAMHCTLGRCAACLLPGFFAQGAVLAQVGRSGRLRSPAQLDDGLQPPGGALQSPMELRGLRTSCLPHQPLFSGPLRPPCTLATSPAAVECVPSGCRHSRPARSGLVLGTAPACYTAPAGITVASRLAALDVCAARCSSAATASMCKVLAVAEVRCAAWAASLKAAPFHDRPVLLRLAVLAPLRHSKRKAVL
jgi:hypothetical protein